MDAFFKNLTLKLDRVESELVLAAAARAASGGGSPATTTGGTTQPLASSAPRRFRSPSTGGAGATAGSPPQEAVLLSELRSLRTVLAGLSAAPSMPLPASPPPPPAPPMPEDATAEALRRELKRVSDAYGVLVRDTRASKAAAAAREAELSTEVDRLKAVVSGWQLRCLCV